jgi:hypothetical protein
MAHPLGMSAGVLDRHRTALGQSDQREPLRLEGVDDRLEILHEGLEGDLVRVVVGEPAPTFVVADEHPVS